MGTKRSYKTTEVYDVRQASTLTFDSMDPGKLSFLLRIVVMTGIHRGDEQLSKDNVMTRETFGVDLHYKRNSRNLDLHQGFVIIFFLLNTKINCYLGSVSAVKSEKCCF